MRLHTGRRCCKRKKKGEVWTPGCELVHWIATLQLPAETIIRGLDFKDAVWLSASSPQLWPHVERLVSLAKLDRKAALADSTPDRLRIPLLTGLTWEQVRDNNNLALRMACRNGYLNMAQWLTEHFGLTPADARMWNNEALRWACRHGRLDMALWLTEHFQLTAADAQAWNNQTLRLACGNGHLAVLQ